jgi:cation transport regulator
MVYSTLAELPESVRHVLPPHAQEIYLSAFNNAWERYADPDSRRGYESQEQVAHKVAWAAVEKEFIKNEAGKWVQKGNL